MSRRTVAAALSCLAAVAAATGCSWAKGRQIKAIQLGAKADLQLLASAEEAFRRERGFYSSDLASLPFRRKDLKQVLYKFGFVGPTAPPAGAKLPAGHDPSRVDLDKLKAALKDVPIEYSETTRLATVDMSAAKALCPDCVVGRDSFKALAVANLDDDPDLDAWTFDSATAQFTHVADDLKPSAAPAR